MNYRKISMLAFLLLVYIAAVGVCGYQFVSYVNSDAELLLSPRETVTVDLDKPSTLDLAGRGFSADTRIFMHLDVNNHNAIVGTVPLTSITHDLELVGDTLFVAGNGNGLKSIDVSDPLNPKMSSLSLMNKTTVLDINRHGDKLYLSCAKNGVQTARITESGRLKRGGYLYTWSLALESEIIGRYLYVAANNDGLLVYDAADLNQKKPMAMIESDVPIRQIAVYKNYLYAVAGKAGVLIYRIDEKGIPHEVSRLPVAKAARSVEVVGSSLYLLEPGRLSQYSLAEPGSPLLVDELTDIKRPARLYSSGETLYVVDHLSGLWLIKNRPEGFASEIRFMNIGANPRRTMAVGDYLYVATSAKELKIIDPTKIQTRQSVETIETNDSLNDMLHVGANLYIVDRDGFYFKDLSVADSPLSLVSPVVYGEIAQAEDRLYLSRFKAAGVDVYDISSAGSPKKIFEWNLRGTVTAVEGRHLILSNAKDKLSLFSLSEPSAPQLLDQVTGVTAHHLTVRGGLLIASEEKKGLSFFSIEKGKLVKLSRLDLPYPLSSFSWAGGAQIAGNILFLANGESGLLIVDIKNPATPEIVSSLYLPGFAGGLLVEEDKVYIASHYSGLHVVDVSELKSPRLVDSIPMSDITDRMFLHAGKLYVGNSMFGISVIPIPVELDVKQVGQERLQVSVPVTEYHGRYSLFASRGDGSGASLNGVLDVQ